MRAAAGLLQFKAKITARQCRAKSALRNIIKNFDLLVMKTRNQLRKETTLHTVTGIAGGKTRTKESAGPPTYHKAHITSPLLAGLLDEPTLCSPSATGAPPKRIPRKLRLTKPKTYPRSPHTRHEHSSSFY